MTPSQMYANGVVGMNPMPNQQMSVGGMGAPGGMMGPQGPMGNPNQNPTNQLMTPAMQQQPGQMPGMGAPFNPQQQWFPQQAAQNYYNQQGVLFDIT